MYILINPKIFMTDTLLENNDFLIKFQHRSILELSDICVAFHIS